MRCAWPILLMLAGCATVSPRPREGVEVAVAFDRAGELGSSASGLADPATGRLATPDDPVRIASVSKVVVAVGVMKLVEKFELDLDADVSRTLGFVVRNLAFPQRPVTLRQLLSHTSSLRDHDDQYAIPLGGSLQAVLADAASWDPARGPGDGYFTYANLNFPVVASIVERITGERFDRWMRREVLDPMKIDSCFNWPTCSDDAVARAIVLTQGGVAIRDDLGGKRPDCAVFLKDGPCDLARWRPGENGALFAPQGGLRISARGLARVGRMLLGDGMLDGVRILAPSSVAEMMRPQWRYDGRNGDSERGLWCRYGLAIQLLATRSPGCADDPGVPRGDWLGHSGEAYGLRSGLWIDRASGTGMAYFATALPDYPPRGRSAFTRPEEALVAKGVSIRQQRP